MINIRRLKIVKTGLIDALTVESKDKLKSMEIVTLDNWRKVVGAKTEERTSISMIFIKLEKTVTMTTLRAIRRTHARKEMTTARKNTSAANSSKKVSIWAKEVANLQVRNFNHMTGPATKVKEEARRI